MENLRKKIRTDAFVLDISFKFKKEIIPIFFHFSHVITHTLFWFEEFSIFCKRKNLRDVFTKCFKISIILNLTIFSYRIIFMSKNKKKTQHRIFSMKFHSWNFSDINASLGKNFVEIFCRIILQIPQNSVEKFWGIPRNYSAEFCRIICDFCMRYHEKFPRIIPQNSGELVE